MKKDNFHFEQYKELRAEALKQVDETRSVERYCLLALAAYYAFLFSNWGRVEMFGNAPWWIPVGLAVCGGIRSWALFMSICNNAEYLRRLEISFFDEWSTDQEPAGWEQFRKSGLSWRRKWALNSALVFWPLLIAGTLWLVWNHGDCLTCV